MTKTNLKVFQNYAVNPSVQNFHKLVKVFKFDEQDLQELAVNVKTDAEVKALKRLQSVASLLKYFK